MEQGGFVVQMSYLQIIIIALTLALMAGFTLVIAATPLGRAQRACEQDMTMAALLGIDVDRTISLTFVLGAALAAVAGMMVMLYYGVIDFFIGFLAGVKAFTAAVLGGIGSLPGAMLGGLLIGLIEAFWSGYFSTEYKDVSVFAVLVLVLIFRPDRPARPARGGEGLMVVRAPSWTAGRRRRSPPASRSCWRCRWWGSRRSISAAASRARASPGSRSASRAVFVVRLGLAAIVGRGAGPGAERRGAAATRASSTAPRHAARWFAVLLDRSSRWRCRSCRSRRAISSISRPRC